MITIDEKIEMLEGIIKQYRWARNEEPMSAPRQILDALRSIVADLRARKATAPNAAEQQIERRLRGIHNAQERGDNPDGAKISMANEVMGRWPVIKQALERFGAEIEK